MMERATLVGLVFGFVLGIFTRKGWGDYVLGKATFRRIWRIHTVRNFAGVRSVSYGTDQREALREVHRMKLADRWTSNNYLTSTFEFAYRDRVKWRGRTRIYPMKIGGVDEP